MSPNQKNARDGTAVVELAITLPVLIFVILATVDVCNEIFLQQSLNVMAFEGARVSVTQEALTTDIENEITKFAAARNVTVESVVVTPADFAGQPIGTFIEVKVTGSSDAAEGLFSDGRGTASVSMMKNY